MIMEGGGRSKRYDGPGGGHDCSQASNLQYAFSLGINSQAEIKNVLKHVALIRFNPF